MFFRQNLKCVVPVAVDDDENKDFRLPALRCQCSHKFEGSNFYFIPVRLLTRTLLPPTPHSTRLAQALHSTRPNAVAGARHSARNAAHARNDTACARDEGRGGCNGESEEGRGTTWDAKIARRGAIRDSRAGERTRTASVSAGRYIRRVGLPRRCIERGTRRARGRTRSYRCVEGSWVGRCVGDKMRGRRGEGWRCGADSGKPRVRTHMYTSRAPATSRGGGAMGEKDGAGLHLRHRDKREAGMRMRERGEREEGNGADCATSVRSLRVRIDEGKPVYAAAHGSLRRVRARARRYKGKAGKEGGMRRAGSLRSDEGSSVTCPRAYTTGQCPRARAGVGKGGDEGEGDGEEDTGVQQRCAFRHLEGGRVGQAGASDRTGRGRESDADGGANALPAARWGIVARSSTVEGYWRRTCARPAARAAGEAWVRRCRRELAWVKRGDVDVGSGGGERVKRWRRSSKKVTL
ncbi:hypothetical protein B0H16DRAFT_1705793 [Mycena metata]|uniref:Uncharacterized protein n=1 Tax=Mycena metata TaxID=1033252 RepID=A0AAD7DU18_9AGAR|nr:hypothetical protein B0H16DRAFT_1705793 [Mycena metata]